MLGSADVVVEVAVDEIAGVAAFSVVFSSVCFAGMFCGLLPNKLLDWKGFGNGLAGLSEGTLPKSGVEALALVGWLGAEALGVAEDAGPDVEDGMPKIEVEGGKGFASKRG